MNINLTSPILRIIEIKKKTSAQMFKDLKLNDLIQLSIPVKRAGRGFRGRSNPSYIEVRNLGTNETALKSFNEIPHLLCNFEFEEVF